MFAGAGLWVLAMAILAQRQRVLHRRLLRLERATGIRERRPVPRPIQRDQDLLGYIGPPPPHSDRPPQPPPAPRRSPPTVQQLARLAVPLQRFGG